MKKLLLIAAAALFALPACKSGEPELAPTEESAAEEVTAEEEAPSEEEAVAEPEPEPEPPSNEPGTLVLETATLPTMGHTMLLPQGFERNRETETGAGYSYDLGDYKTIMVSLEPQGADSADRARSLGPVVAGGLTVKDVEDLGEGRFLVIFVTRESDGMQAVALFTATHYAKCMGPEAHQPQLREMCASLAPVQ
ncbi:MAG: hypothetical protein ACJAYU_001996 [Bradymonadia bacterium]|jgi:hypothetical protein